MDYNKPEALNVITGNIADNYKQFKEEVLIYFEATETDKKTNKVQIARLKNLLGSEALKLYNTIKANNDEAESVLSILNVLERHCIPKRNETMAIHIFLSRKQLAGESFDKFYIDLKSLISPCEFENQSDKILRSQIIMGLSSTSVKERLLRDDLSLDKVIQYCRSVEAAEDNIKIMMKNQPNQTICSAGIDHIVRQQTRLPQFNDKLQPWTDAPYTLNKGNKSTANLKVSTNCSRCGYFHDNKHCPAQNKICSKCKKPNHFAKVCRTKVFTGHEVESNVQDELTQPECILNEEIGTVVNVDIIKARHWTVTIEINKRLVVFKIDTGADVNIISTKILNSLALPKHVKIKPSKTRLEAFCGFKINSVGEVTLPAKVASKSFNITFIVVDSEKATPIIGLNSSIMMGLIKKLSIDVVGKIPDVNTLVEEYKDVFFNQGVFPEVLKLRLKEGAIPKSSPARRVPNKLSERLKLKLDSLENRKIIEKCESGEWVHNLVIVEKHKTGDLRICVDPKDLNKYLVRDYVLIPTLEEITAKLAKKKYFCVFDLKDGFHQVPLDEESSKLCTFSTPFGTYRYLRAPFGLSVLPEYFHKTTTKFFSDVKGVIVYFDDILCAAETKEELIETVLEVMKTARKNHIQLNKDKIQYFVEKVKFLGHEFDCNGVKPDSERIKAINELEIPTNKTELQRILGTVNNLRPFIPNLAEHCSYFQELLKKNVIFQWTQQHSQHFQKLKESITNATLLCSFDSNTPLTIQADSSSYSVGCSLFQNGKPVMFGSRSLSESEKNYAQIEKELLAIVYAFKKFHNFVYGQSNIEVQSDHAPLLSIFSKPIHQITNNRLKRLRLKLLNYSFYMTYIPGNKLYVADLLSRQCSPTQTQDDESMLDIVHTVNEVKINPKTISQYIEATKDDESLSKVMQFYQDGWPKKCPPNNHELTHYFSIRNDLTVQDGLVYFNERLIVPPSLRRYTLKTLHETHLGLNKLKLKAHSLVYWPGIMSDLKNLIDTCVTCAKFQRAKLKDPLQSHEVFDIPFYKVSADIADFDSASYLVLIDYYCRWIEVERIRDKKALTVIAALKPIFARFGIPSIFVSDNIPFNSQEFIDFSKLWNFEAKFTSPHYPRSNGLVEKAVGIVKSMLRKAKFEKSDISLYLLNYRSSPVANLKYTPSQLLQSRVLNIKLPIRPSQLKPQIVCDKAVTEKLGQAQQYNRTALNKTSVFTKGQKVMVKNVVNQQWDEGVIQDVLENRSYLVEVRGRILRRNSWYIRPIVECTSSGRIIRASQKLSL